MTIVCGTDLSERSRPGVAAAAAIARRAREPLWLVHVVVGADRLELEARERVLSTAWDALEHEARIVEARTAGARLQVLAGDPVRELLAFAEVAHATMMVVASPAHADASPYRPGRTSERIVLDAPYPVLVVRDASPFQAWAQRARPLRVVVGADFTASSSSAVRWVKMLREAGPCDVLVGHVCDADGVLRRCGGGEVTSLVESDPGAGSLLERDLATMFGALGGAGRVSFRAHLGAGRTADDLAELAAGEHADLVVVGTHHRHGPARRASVSREVLRLGHMSVATVPTSPGTMAGPAGIPEVKRVLAATDLSDGSSWAVAFAYALLGPGGGEVHLLHVVQTDAEGAEADADLAARLRTLSPEGADRKGIVTHVEVTHGPVVAEICSAAERLGVDAVCLGSHGSSGLHALLGSVVAAVLRESARPVLVVRPPPP